MTLLPHNLEAEQALLGSLLMDHSAIAKVADTLPSDAFFDTKHQWIYRAMKYLWDQRIPGDFVTLTNKLSEYRKIAEAGGRDYIAGLAAAVPTASYAEYYADIIRQTAQSRATIFACEDIITRATDGPVDPDDIVQSIRSATAPFAAAPTGGEYGSILDVAERHIAEVSARWDGTLNELVIPTGIRELDKRMMGGLRPGELLILGGRPGQGKTSIALQQAVHAARMAGRHVLFNCLEMQPTTLMERMVSAETGLPFEVAHRHLVGVNDRERWLETATQLSALPFEFDAQRTTAKIRARCDRIAGESPLGLVVIDHIGLLKDELRKESTAQNTAEISHRLKEMAMDLQVPIVVLSQLNRDVEAHPPYSPSLHNLKNSGALEEDADYVLLLYRRMYYVEKGMLTPDASADRLPASDRHRVELTVAKSRNGAVGPVHIGWNPASMSFHEEAA